MGYQPECIDCSYSRARLPVFSEKSNCDVCRGLMPLLRNPIRGGRKSLYERPMLAEEALSMEFSKNMLWGIDPFDDP